MSKAAISSKVFAVYLVAMGTGMITIPNALLSIFSLPSSPDVWIRVVGVLALMMGVYAWVAAVNELKAFFVASVYTRGAVFLIFSAFALLELSKPQLALFGLIDLMGGVWTFSALRTDAR